MAFEPVRVLVAKPGLDGHDRGAKVIARILRDSGFEVVYSGLHQTLEDIAAIARDEDVAVVGLSVLSGAHLPYTRQLRQLLDEMDLAHVKIVVGGIVPLSDINDLERAGAAAVFPPNSDVLSIPDRLRDIVGVAAPIEPCDV